MFALARKFNLPSASAALQGRAEAVSTAPVNLMIGNPMQGPYPAHLQQCIFGMDYCSRQGSDSSCIWTVPTTRKFSEAHA